MKSKISTSQPTRATVKSVFAAASAEGVLSAASKDLLCINLDDNVLAGCAGIDLDDIEATEVTLVSLLLDDSGSMRGFEKSVMDGHKELLDALKGSKQKEYFLVGMWALNGAGPIHSYVKVDDAVKLDASNYSATGCTPLYDKWCEMLAANVAYAQQLRASGTAVRSIAVVITDGRDEHSRKFRATDCARLAKDLLDSEQFILALVGVGDEPLFRDVGRQMGIPDGSVLVAGKTASEIRKVFRLVSQSVIRASQANVNPVFAQNAFFAP